MPDNPRIEDLRRRVEKDPASIAFAQLAEEYRRAGLYAESIDTCRAGLVRHPTYLSARVTLGRSLIEAGQFDEAQRELELVLKSASENLAAIRGLAEIFHKRGELAKALTQYKAALALARNDPDLQETVNDLSYQLEPKKEPELNDGLSFEQMGQELAKHAPLPAITRSEEPDPPKQLPPPITPPPSTGPLAVPSPSERAWPSPVLIPAPTPEPPIDAAIPAAHAQALRTIAALEQWLAAIHVARAERHA